MIQSDDSGSGNGVPVDPSGIPGGLMQRFALGLRARGTQWMVAGAGLAAFGAYLFQLFGTRALGEARYAPIGTLWTIQYLLVSVALLPVETYVARESLRASGRDPRWTGVSYARLWLWLSVLALASTAACWLLREQLFHGLHDLALVVGVLVIVYAAFLIVRGRLAGAERYKAYGLVTATESMTRAGLAAVAAALAAGAGVFAWIMPVGPALAAAWWLLLRRTRLEGAPTPTSQTTAPGNAKFFASTTAANAIMQTLLAGGPLLLAFLHASPEEISIFFVTVTAVRVPLVFAFGGMLSRLLPTFMRLGAGDVDRGPTGVAIKIAIGTLVAAALLGIAAARVGAQVVAFLFGKSFEPPWWLAAGATVGVVLATGSILLYQLLIARGGEVRGLIAWCVALIAAALAVALTNGSPTARAVVGLMTGEIIALVGLVVVAGRTASPFHFSIRSSHGP
jgi:O-antigen/teichoic acid export membrane protein